MANKIKVADKFDGVVALLMGEPTEFSVEQAVEFIKERKAQHEKKNAGGGERKPTKTQVENEGVKSNIVSTLAVIGVPASITDIQKSSAELGAFSNQKLSALLTQLVKAKAVVRTEVKGKAHFALPSAEE